MGIGAKNFKFLGTNFSIEIFNKGFIPNLSNAALLIEHNLVIYVSFLTVPANNFQSSVCRRRFLFRIKPYKWELKFLLFYRQFSKFSKVSNNKIGLKSFAKNILFYFWKKKGFFVVLASQTVAFACA